MQRLDLAFPRPAEQLAAEEALLDWCEAGRGGETLAFWEPREVFVVVGYANKVAAEVNVAACERHGVPILRRCSGGGAVVQMPGGLNYSLVLRIAENTPTRNISTANQFIMEKNRAAIESAVGDPALTVVVRGHTDLALGRKLEVNTLHSVKEAGSEVRLSGSVPAGGSPAGTGGSPVPPIRSGFRKFAGNSQRRRKHFLLFHGTLLLNCDLNLIGELLRMPSLQPDYRAGRMHAEFVTNLNLPVAAVKAALAQAWNADSQSDGPPRAEIERLAREKYATNEWNCKF